MTTTTYPAILIEIPHQYPATATWLHDRADLEDCAIAAESDDGIRVADAEDDHDLLEIIGHDLHSVRLLSPIEALKWIEGSERLHRWARVHAAVVECLCEHGDDSLQLSFDLAAWLRPRIKDHAAPLPAGLGMLARALIDDGCLGDDDLADPLAARIAADGRVVVSHPPIDTEIDDDQNERQHGPPTHGLAYWSLTQADEDGFVPVIAPDRDDAMAVVDYDDRMPQDRHHDTTVGYIDSATLRWLDA